MNRMQVNIISPDEEIFGGMAEMVVIPGEEGDFAAMFEHAPLITYMRPGKLEISTDDKESDIIFFVGGGFVKVADNKCLIMVDYIKKSSDIDLKTNEQKINSLKSEISVEKNDVEKENISKSIDILQAEIDLISSK